MEVRLEEFPAWVVMEVKLRMRFQAECEGLLQSKMRRFARLSHRYDKDELTRPIIVKVNDTTPRYTQLSI